MSWFQLDPHRIAERANASNSKAPLLAESLIRGTIGFTIVSVAGFIPWALFGRTLYRSVGEAGLYTICALIFIGLSGPLMHRLIIGSGSLRRFYQLFSISFAAYSIAWMVGWMTLRGHIGGVVGLLAGTSIMGWILATAFDAHRIAWRVILSLFFLNTIGYFVGGVFEAALIRQHALTVKLLWGVCYGIGFGAGLGLAFYICQGEARRLIRG